MEGLVDKLRAQLLRGDSSSAGKLARLKTLTEILMELQTSDIICDSVEKLDKCFSQLVQCFSDPCERSRECAVQIVDAVVSKSEHSVRLYTMLLPALCVRLDQQELLESSEEVRLLQIRLVADIVSRDGQQLAPFLEELVPILSRCIDDSAPDVKRTACTAAGELARLLPPAEFYSHGPTLVPPLLRAVGHRRWRVREPCVRALGDVVQFGNNAALTEVISHLAQRSFDQVPQVRLAVAEVAGRWLSELPDRYSFFSRVLPLLLSALDDDAPAVADRAAQLWRQAGQVYLQENEDENRDLINFPPPPPAGHPSPATRPSLGCRLLVQRHVCTIIPGAVNDLSDWVPETRHKVAQLLRTLLLHAEHVVNEYAQRLVDSFLMAMVDEDERISRLVVESAELLGCFITETVLKLVVLRPVSRDGAGSGRKLVLLAACLRSTPFLEQLLLPVAQLVAEDDICRSHVPLQIRGVFDTVEVLLQAVRECRLVSLESEVAELLFVAVVSAIGHAVSDELNQRGVDLVNMLSKILQEDVATLTKLYGPHLLDRLEVSLELWTDVSSELIVFMALLNVSESPSVLVLEKAMPMMSFCCHPDRDPSLRLLCFGELNQLLSRGEISAADLGLRYVTDDIISTSLVWRSGRSHAAIRTAAVSTLYGLLQRPSLAVSDVTGDLRQLLVALVGVLDDDAVRTRLLALRSMKRLLGLTRVGSVCVDQVHTTWTELTKRLDDSDTAVRHEAAKTISALVNLLDADYNVDHHRGYLQYFVDALLVFLDDQDAVLQQLVLEALTVVGRRASLVCDKAMEQRNKHRSTVLCDRLVNSLSGLKMGDGDSIMVASIGPCNDGDAVD